MVLFTVSSWFIDIVVKHLVSANICSDISHHKIENNNILIFIYYLVSDNNESLGPYYDLDEKFFHNKIWELVRKYNYTLNPKGIYEAIKWQYTYWPEPDNKERIRDQYINVSFQICILCVKVTFFVENILILPSMILQSSIVQFRHCPSNRGFKSLFLI